MPEHHRTEEVLVKVEDVSLKFGEKLILRDINLAITNIDNVGQVICFLGPSGLGKTQLSRVIAGLQRPTTGRVLLKDGGDGQLAPTARGKVCMVPQNYPMFDYATVRGNLTIAGRQGGFSSSVIKEKIASYAQSFGLEQYLDSYPATLSGGTKQRVAIVRQMMCASHLLILDEPFSGLDPIMKARAQEAIQTLASLDTYNTIIIVTHDVTEGLAVADTAWLMGYEPAPDAPGRFYDGATIVEQIDLAAQDLCWHEQIAEDPRFITLVNAVKARFQTLR